MSTRSLIAIENTDGTVESVYCHWDGYVEYNGKILFNNYKTEAIVRELIAGGNMSTLGVTPRDCLAYSPIEPAETDVSVKALVDSAKEGTIEYVYVFTKGNWMGIDLSRNSVFDLAYEVSKIKETV